MKSQFVTSNIGIEPIILWTAVIQRRDRSFIGELLYRAQLACMVIEPSFTFLQDEIIKSNQHSIENDQQFLVVASTIFKQWIHR